MLNTTILTQRFLSNTDCWIGAASEAGNILSVNMVLLGALIQTGKIPLTKETVKDAIKRKTNKAFVETNLKAFEFGFSKADSLT